MPLYAVIVPETLLVTDVLERTGLRRIDHARSSRVYGRGRGHSLGERAGVVDRDVNAHELYAVARYVAARLHAADRAADLAHRGRNGDRCVLSGLDRTAVCRAEVDGQLHLSVVYHVAERLTLADLLADTIGRRVAVRIGRRYKPAGDRRGNIEMVELVLRGNERILRLRYRVLRLCNGALRLDKLFLRGLELLARFSRIDCNEKLTGNDLIALGDKNLRNLALDVAAELFALAG